MADRAEVTTFDALTIHEFKSKEQYVEKMREGAIKDGDLCFFEEEELKLDKTLKLSNEGVLGVNTTTEVEKDNTLPITAAAVHTTVGNIEVLLGTI